MRRSSRFNDGARSRGEKPLFHSLFVFENAPVDPALCEGRIIFRAEEEQYRVHTNYPLTVMGWPGRELGLKISYDRRLFDADTTGAHDRAFRRRCSKRWLNGRLRGSPTCCRSSRTSGSNC